MKKVNRYMYKLMSIFIMSSAMSSALFAQGSWTAPFATGVEAVHMAVLNTDRVFTFSVRSGAPYLWGTFNPENPPGSTASGGTNNYFCAGHTVMADGRFIMVDGTANGALGLFNPASESWTSGGNTATSQVRWYPSTIILGNGKVFTIGGTDDGGHGASCSGGDRSGEIYDPATNSSALLNGGSNLMPNQDADAYPRVFLMWEQNANPNIFRVFNAGPFAQSWYYTINTDNNTASVANGDVDNFAPTGGCAQGRLQATYARLDDGRVMAIGGFPFNEGTTTSSVSIIDPEAASPNWTQAASLGASRHYTLGTLLADGTLMVIGGEAGNDNNRLTPELYNPATNSWSNLANHPFKRNYHTSSVLLPSGKVCMSGGEDNGGPGDLGETDQMQVYTPDYLTAGARPVINSVPTAAGYGSTINVTYSSSNPINDVILRRPGTSTHGFTYNMIGAPCSYTDNGGSLSVTIPSNPNRIPPGFYLLFIFSDNSGTKVPSVAKWIKIDGSAPPADNNPPSQPSISGFSNVLDTSLTVSSSVSTDAEGSTPVQYQFNETTGNTGATDSGWQNSINYSDSGLNASTQYCYQVRARDSQGNTTGYSSASCTNTTAGPDTDPPTPNPMTFAVAPAAIGDAVISMTATTATDAQGATPVEYQFEETTGGPGADDSAWQQSFVYYDYGLTGGTQYTYRVRARDSLGNTGSYSAAASATTAPEDGFTDISVGPGTVFNPADVTINVGDTVQWTFLEEGHNVWAGLSGNHNYLLGQPPVDSNTIFNSTIDKNTTNPLGTTFNVTFNQALLDSAAGDGGASNIYNYHCHIHGSGFPFVMFGAITVNGGTDTAAPIPNPMTFATAPNATSSTSIDMVASTALDAQSAPVQYFFDEVSGNTGGSDSAWQSSTSYTDTGLNPLTMYSYTVAARDALGNTTAASSVGNATTPDAPSNNILLETGVVSGVGNSWTTVNLGSSYSSMVVVATPGYSNSSAPAHVRIQNATGNSFQVRVDGSPNAPASMDVYYMVIEEGVYTVATDGVKMEAVKYTSTVTSNNNSWVGEARSYSNSYTSPVVLGQVMTYNDAGHVTFWSRGNSRQNPPSSSALQVGKTVNEDPDNAHGNETIGYIVLESGNGAIDGVNYAAGVTSDGVAGVTNNPPYGRPVSGLTGAASVGIATLTAMDGGNGGWALFYGTNPISNSSINLAIDEDQLNDTERNHTGEQVAYIVFEDAAMPPDTTAPTPNPATFASAPAATSSSAISMTATTASDPSTPVEYQFAETSGNPGATGSGWQSSTSYSDTGLNASTQYCYTVQSRDSAGNSTTASAASCATTQAPPADTTPPTPNPATFGLAPASGGISSINMTATTASDPSGPVEYFFTETSGNPGGSNSVWQTSTSYTDTGLSPSTQYCYTVTSRDSVGNTGASSAASCATTDALPDTNAPSSPSISSAVADSDTQITVTSTVSTDAEGSNPVEYQFNETTGGAGATDSGWQTGTTHVDTGLSASTQYCYQVRSRDSVGNTNTYSATSCATTQAGSGCGSTWQAQVNNTDGSINYSGFSGNVEAGGALNNDAQWGPDGSASATFTINGSGVRIYVWRFDDSQSATVTIDGQQVGTINVGSGNEAQVLGFETTSLSCGPHTVVVTRTGGELHFDSYQVRN